jgi:hypothetical protein
VGTYRITVAAPPGTSGIGCQAIVDCRVFLYLAEPSLFTKLPTGLVFSETHFLVAPEFPDTQLRAAERWSVRRVMSSSCSQPAPVKE